MDERMLRPLRDTAATSSCRMQQPRLVDENNCFGEVLCDWSVDIQTSGESSIFRLTDKSEEVKSREGDNQ
jgi:hypothetical protein